jgi:hypothetical protein
MAKSCGIYIGLRRWAVVVLEGNAKKHHVILQQSGTIPSGEDSVNSTARDLREVAKKVKVHSENIGLAIDSGLASYRTLSLPFDDPSKIEEVIKFEVESDLPQWDIDDVIVDFLTLHTTPGVESTLLVTAVPKERLEARLRACERAGMEPYEAELDTTALFNAAHAVGLLRPDGAQVLLHVGDTTTSVVVVDGGKLLNMRSIHTGVAPATFGAAPEAGAGAGAEGAAPEAEPAAPPPPIDLEVDARRRAGAAARIRREVARTISGATTDHPFEGVYVTGLQLPELYTEPLLDVPVAPFVGLPGEGDDVGECAVAYGAALRPLGAAVLKGTLRREELRYTGKFERLELPLAVFGMLLLTCLWVQLVVVNRQILWRGEGNLAREQRGDMQIWLEASNQFMLPNPEDDYPGRLKAPPADLEAYARKAQKGEDDERTKMEQLKRIEQLLTIEIDKVKRELGHISEVVQPQSALEAMTVVLGLMEEKKDEIGRVALRKLAADTQQTRGDQQPYVLVKLDIDFFAENDVEATKHYNLLQSALEAQVWCKEFERKPNKTLDDNQGIYVEGMTIQVDTSKLHRPEEGS